jgi:hypothetical protein
MFDSASVLAIAQPSSVAYAAFFSDIEHEVVPVTSGYRVTLTYNLFFDDHKRVSAKDLVLEPPSTPQDENERIFRSSFGALLKNPEFLPDGGTLGFGLRHVYQAEDTLEHVYSLLKDSDVAFYQSLRALGFAPVLYLYYGQLDDDDFEAVLTKRYLPERRQPVPRHGLDVTPLRWNLHLARPRSEVGHTLTAINHQECAYPEQENKGALGMAYGDVCPVRIGEAGERLAYLTAVEVRKESAKVHCRFY